MKVWNTARELIEWIGHHHNPMHEYGGVDIIESLGDLTLYGQLLLSPAAAADYHIKIDGTAKLNANEQALYINFPSETVATNAAWFTLGSTVTSGDLTGLRSRVTGNAASAGANVRGAYLEAKGGASKYAAMLEGSLSHADYSAGSVTVSGDVRGFTAQISQGTGLNAANLYGGLINIQTRGNETITSDDVGLKIRNEAVGGTGRQMDAAILLAEANLSGGIKSFGYGIDMNGLNLATADIRFANSETMIGLDDVPVDAASTSAISSNWAYDLTQVTREPTGFPNTTDTSAPTFSSPTITLAKTNGSFDFYIKGVKFTKSANQTVALPNGDANDIGTWYIAFNSSGVLTATKTTSWDIAAADSCPVAVLYFNGTAGRISDERHGAVMDAATHDLLHYTVGCRFESGLTGTFTDPTAIAVALGKIHDEDIEYSIDAQTQCIPFYHSSGVYTFAAAQNSYVVQVSDILQYDNLTDLVDVSNNSYVAYWIFATLDTTKPIWIMPGQREDALLKNARDNNKYESLSLGTLPFPEMKLLYRVILRRSGTSETYTETQDLRTVSNLPSGTYVATDHAALTGLLDDDHTQYILHSLADAADDFLIASGADTFAKQTLAQTLTTLGKAAASGLASLNASTKVVEQPASISDHLDDTAGGTDAATTKGITSNVHYDHCNEADPHAGYVLESLADASGDFLVASGNDAFAKQTTAQALATLSPLTTRGDIMFRDATVSTRLAKGTDNYILAMGADDPEWKTPATILADIGAPSTERALMFAQCS